MSFMVVVIKGALVEEMEHGLLREAKWPEILELGTKTV